MSDLLNHLRVIVVEDIFGAVCSKMVRIVRTTSRDYVEAIDDGELDGIQTHACC